eukprot:COSAG06_NODE_2956_length_6028_cov_7.551864_6_plen_65_part_00
MTNQACSLVVAAMEQQVPEGLRRALHAIGERAATGVRTWQRLLEFIDLCCCPRMTDDRSAILLG